MSERAQHHLYSPLPPSTSSTNAMPSCVLLGRASQLWPGSSQHVAAKEPRAGRAAEACPSICCAKLSRAIGPGASTGTVEGPEETEQTKIASFLLVPPGLAGCTGDPRALGTCRFRADSEQLAWPLGRGQPRVTTSPPAASDKLSRQSQALPRLQAFAQAVPVVYQSLLALSLIL